MWDPRQKDTPVANMEPIEGENKRDCWTVAFGKIQFFHLRSAFSKTAITMSEQLRVSAKQIYCLCNSNI